MAGWIVVRKLEKATPPQSMLDGIHLWKWDEVIESLASVVCIYKTH